MMEKELAYMVGKAVGAECEEKIILENNGNAKHALVIREPGAEVCPTIYIDGILESIRNGETGMGEAVTAVTDIYREARSPEWLQGIRKRLMEKGICPGKRYIPGSRTGKKPVQAFQNAA